MRETHSRLGAYVRLRSTFRARILTVLSRSVMTTNNSAKQTIFSLLCANSVLIYFVTNNTFQRYVTNENI